MDVNKRPSIDQGTELTKRPSIDRSALVEVKSNLQHSECCDRSAPSVEDAAHPGSAGVLRAISVGAYDLKHAEADDRSAPIIEAGVVVKPSPIPSLVAEIAETSVVLSEVKHMNDRSAPQIPAHPTGVTTKKPAQKAVVEELLAKRDTIEEASATLSKQSVSGIEKEGLVRPQLVEELKGYSSYIATQADHLAKHSVGEMSKHTRPALVDEIKKQRPSIENLTYTSAVKAASEDFRSITNPSLVNEIKLKAPSIDALTHLHRSNSQETSE